MENKNIIIGSDHAGLNLKKQLVNFLNECGYNVTDIGTYTQDSCDYPLIAKKLAEKITLGEFVRGILVCGTGLGMCITANKFKRVRAVAVSDTTSARCSRSHNDSNVLCLGERIVGEYLAKDIVQIWLNTNFAGERHLNRVNMIEN